MKDKALQKTLLRLLVLTVLTACWQVLPTTASNPPRSQNDTNQEIDRSPQNPATQSDRNNKQLRIVPAQQSDSPLLIQSTNVDLSNPLNPQYEYLITNNSNKPIRAFTVQDKVSLNDGGQIISNRLSHFPTAKLFLMPHESKQEEGGLGKTYQSPPLEIELSADFVEFADGTRWGSDVSASSNKLDGIRAGGKAAINKYREILTTEGVSGVEQLLANQNLVSPDNQSRPNTWNEGFRVGVDIVKSRLREAKAKKGQEEIKNELNKSFDSTEGRQEQ
jgi:hypothetical protein